MNPFIKLIFQIAGENDLIKRYNQYNYTALSNENKNQPSTAIDDEVNDVYIDLITNNTICSEIYKLQQDYGDRGMTFLILSNNEVIIGIDNKNINEFCQRLLSDIGLIIPTYYLDESINLMNVSDTNITIGNNILSYIKSTENSGILPFVRLILEIDGQEVLMEQYRLGLIDSKEIYDVYHQLLRNNTICREIYKLILDYAGMLDIEDSNKRRDFLVTSEESSQFRSRTGGSELPSTLIISITNDNITDLYDKLTNDIGLIVPQYYINEDLNLEGVEDNIIIANNILNYIKIVGRTYPITNGPWKYKNGLIWPDTLNGSLTGDKIETLTFINQPFNATDTFIHPGLQIHMRDLMTDSDLIFKVFNEVYSNIPPEILLSLKTRDELINYIYQLYRPAGVYYLSLGYNTIDQPQIIITHKINDDTENLFYGGIINTRLLSLVDLVDNTSSLIGLYQLARLTKPTYGHHNTGITIPKEFMIQLETLYYNIIQKIKQLEGLSPSQKMRFSNLFEDLNKDLDNPDLVKNPKIHGSPSESGSNLSSGSSSFSANDMAQLANLLATKTKIK